MRVGYDESVIIEVDQSIKVEQTAQDTVVGVSNDRQCAVIIPRQVKRKLKAEFRRRGIPNQFAYRTFITALVLALEKANYNHLSDVVIDIEYVGQEGRLRDIFCAMWRKRHRSLPHVSFRLIGKKSGAHEVAYYTMRKERKPDAVLSYNELRKLVFS